MTTNTKQNKQMRDILKENGLSDWSVKIIHSGGGLTVFKTKEIWLDASHFNLVFFLHELTHALGYKGHDAIWADKYTALLEKYLFK